MSALTSSADGFEISNFKQNLIETPMLATKSYDASDLRVQFQTSEIKGSLAIFGDKRIRSEIVTAHYGD